MKEIFERLQAAISEKLTHLLWLKNHGVTASWDDGKSLDEIIENERRAYENVTSAMKRLDESE